MLCILRCYWAHYKSESEDIWRQIEVDYCNEILAFNILYWNDILKIYHENLYGEEENLYDKAVNRIQLNRTNLKYCDHKFFDDRVELVEKWSSYLPGLTQLCWYLEFSSIWLT